MIYSYRVKALPFSDSGLSSSEFTWMTLESHLRIVADEIERLCKCLVVEIGRI